MKKQVEYIQANGKDKHLVFGKRTQDDDIV